ncbi:MAG: sulfurtransferase TusA family protein [Anaerolineales bacterium]|jgi:tRNA 2-thiouridine synthesizing protein A
MSQDFDLELDCKGLSCPMPILKTKKFVDGMEVGQIVKMTATDAGSIPDVQAWTTKTGHELVSHDEQDGVYTFYIKKTARA